MDSLVSSAPRKIGNDTCGPLAFGCWRLTDPDISKAQELLETALEAGMTLIDTADVYGLDYGGAGFGDSETILGKALAQAPSLRNEYLIATKGGILPPLPYDSSKKYLTQACDDSLRRLGIDTIDLYQIHRPDVFTHPSELAETLEGFREAGKIRHIGVSNFTPDQHAALGQHLSEPLATNQPEFSAATLAPMKDGTFDLCMAQGVTPLAWSPLAGGRLATGEGVSAELTAVLDRLAQRENTDRTAVALAFVLAHPSSPVAIVGTTRPERIKASTKAFDVKLDRNDCYDIIAASQGFPLP